MQQTTADDRCHFERLDRYALAEYQLERLNRLLAHILPANRFYADKLKHIARPLKSLDELALLPLTTKDELMPPAAADRFPANLTFPHDHYVRFHQTSGTRGHPLVIVDTQEDWNWWIATWQYVLDAAEMERGDRAMLAFSFGPFIGFWSARDAIAARGAMVVPSGGMSTQARLELLKVSQATFLFCTPTYALRLAEVAEEQGIGLAELPLRRIVVAGEPGGSIPAVRSHIEDAFAAKVIDHSGASEIGPWGYADRDQRGLHVTESEFLAEFISMDTGQPAEAGELSRLILTPLGRSGCPVIRYQTGDLVRPTWPADSNRFVLLEGGIVGRVDDMVVIRGVNIFPSSIDQILRETPDVVEYRSTVRRVGEMDQLSIEVEDRQDQPQRIAEQLQLRLGLSIDVTAVPLGSLPRSEGKGQRFVDER